MKVSYTLQTKCMWDSIPLDRAHDETPCAVRSIFHRESLLNCDCDCYDR